MSLTIGITHCDEWANYERWLKDLDSGLNIINLKAGQSNIEELDHFDGIILSGGEDVHPQHYNKLEYIEKYKLSKFNEERDLFELNILEKVTTKQIPLLGICRGLQITNVFYGGTLVPDLPSFNKVGHSNGKKDTEHPVELKKDSQLFNLIGEEKGTINSHHHQSADAIGNGLKAVAFSDGVVEGIEKVDNKDNSFFILVQWHPERMNTANPFSGKLREAFLKACKQQTVTI